MRRATATALALAALLAAADGGAAAGEPRFRFERPVLPGASGPNRLEPDVALLGGAEPVADGTAGEGLGSFQGGLGDLRLFDGAGREVPYLLVPPVRRGPEWRSGRLLALAPRKNESGFELDLGTVEPVDRLRVGGLPAPWLKRFRLEGSGDRSRWMLLVAEGTLFDLPEEGLARTEVDFPASTLRYLRLVWDDAASARLPVPGTASARRARPADPAPPTRVPVAFARRPSEPGKSRFRLRLPAARLPVAALCLEVPGGPLLRPAAVTEGRLAGGEILPASLGRAILRRAVRDGVAAADLCIPVARPEGPDLELEVDDGDNPPLALAAVTGEFAPLPWIYFEAADAAPLTARYGAPAVATPRYDLEAAREVLGRLQPAPARWGEARERDPRGVAAAAVPLPARAAPLDPGSFRYSRPLPRAVPGLTSLLLDAGVLAHSPDLADVRIVDAGGRQIPYLLERRREPLSLALPALAPAARKGDPPGLSRYRLALPEAPLPEARLVFETPARVFERQLRLIEPESEGRRGPAGRVLAESTWRHTDPETPAPALTLSLRWLPANALEVLVDEGDNAPLPFAPPRLLLPAFRLRYFQPPGAASAASDIRLRLLYGKPGLAPPRYDLALLAPRLLGAESREVELPPSRPSAGEDSSKVLEKRIFWGALAAAVLALLLVLARLLRAPSASAGSDEPGG